MEQWDNGNFFLKLNSSLGLYLTVLTTPKTSPDKLSLTVVGIQELRDIEKTDLKKLLCPKKTLYRDRRTVCVNFTTHKQDEFCRVLLPKQFIPHR